MNSGNPSERSESQPARRSERKPVDRGAETLPGRDAAPDRGLRGAEAPGGGAAPGQVARYRILRLLGEGGMGSVYLAEQESPRRRVALKVIRPGITTPSLLRRFDLEAEVLGRLQHPGIAQVYEAGTIDFGAGAQPFFAMELVDGRSIADAARTDAMDTRARLELVARICDAVHHAHQKGVIHRDLKPGNILVAPRTDESGRPDPVGQPKVLDFGVARVTDADRHAATLETGVGQVVGTIPYMSPEQIVGDTDAIDIRSDVYAIGVIAYELLTGRRPHVLDRVTLAQAARIITEHDPDPLSSIRSELRGDVDTIVRKAIRRDREARYDSAADLAADIRRYLRSEPITARPPSVIYHVSRFVRRHRALSASVCLLLLSLIAGIVLSASGFAMASRQRDRAVKSGLDATAARDEALQAAIEAERARREAERAFARAKGINDFLVRDLLGAADPAAAQGETITVEMVLAEAVRRVDRALGDAPDLAGAIHQTIGKTYMGLGRYDEGLAAFGRSVAAYESAHGARSSEALSVTVESAAALVYLGRPAEAEAALRDALPDLRAALGEDAEAVIIGESILAVSFSDRGRLDEVEATLGPLLARARRALGEEHEQTGIIANNYGYLLADLGRFAEAEEIFRRLYDARRARLGADHPRTMLAAGNLAITLVDLGRLGDAGAFYETEVVARSRVVFGDGHPHTINAMANLASMRRMDGRSDLAVTIMEEVVARSTDTLGARHPSVLGHTVELAGQYTALGRHEEAVALNRAVAAQGQTAFGEDHPRYFHALNALGIALAAAGDHHAAIESFRTALDGRGRVLGADHPATLATRHNLGAALVRIGAASEARRMFESALAGRLTALGSDHPDVAATRAALADLLAREGDAGEAIDLLRAAFDTRRTGQGLAHRETMHTACALVRALLSAGAADEALAIVELFTIPEGAAADGANAGDVWTTLHVLRGQVLEMLGRSR
ncbi:MAG: tetratricopeptide repeat protein [Phycisphaeraceae bacterium]|nr:tetratricopeptide repeat protein [Phycisphaeraceae bacterium]